MVISVEEPTEDIESLVAACLYWDFVHVNILIDTIFVGQWIVLHMAVTVVLLITFLSSLVWLLVWEVVLFF
jgi:hypothetical protein